MNIEPLAQWIIERHRIYVRRKANRPFSDGTWTLDPILREWRFCNVYRELDTTTEWIAKHLRVRVDAMPSTEWWWMACARLINYIPTLRALAQVIPVGYGWRRSLFESVMERLTREGAKTYTSAYMLQAPRGPGAGPKYLYTASILDEMWLKNPDLLVHLQSSPLTQHSNACERAWEWLTEVHGIGDFLGYQIVVDLEHTPVLRDASDRETFVAIGPGTRRGLNRVFGRDLSVHLPRAQEQEQVREIQAALARHRTLKEWPLHISDVANSLCEMDKYQRVKSGEGQPRERYRPRGDE